MGAFDVDQKGLATLSEEVSQPALVTGTLDVRDAAAWAMVMTAFAAAAGRLDVLFNNAGILYSGPFESIPLEYHHRLVDVNIKGILERSGPGRVEGAD